MSKLSKKSKKRLALVVGLYGIGTLAARGFYRERILAFCCTSGASVRHGLCELAANSRELLFAL